jgi:hypothetical protein
MENSRRDDESRLVCVGLKALPCDKKALYANLSHVSTQLQNNTLVFCCLSRFLQKSENHSLLKSRQ